MVMSVEPLTIKNEQFMVKRTIEQCPQKMMLRELVMNAIEAAEKDDRGFGEITIGAKRIPECGDADKLFIFNTGPGMSATELKSICDLSSTIGKYVSMDGNFGIGAKVASLASNKLGIRYRSCRNNKISQVVLCCDDNGNYGKYVFYVDGIFDTVIDVTERAVNDEGYSNHHEWTEVLLLGNEKHQNTIKSPYGDTDEEPSWIPKKLYDRFFRIPKNVKIKLSSEAHTKGHDATRTFEPISNRFDSYTQHEAVALDNGITIHYFHDKIMEGIRTQKTQSYSGALCYIRSNNYIVYKGEMYNYREGKSWRPAAPAFGIPFGSNVLSVSIELPNDYPVRPDGYREAIRYVVNNEIVETDHFQRVVIDNRPQWFLDVIASHSPKPDTDDEITKQLQDLLNNSLLRTKSPVLQPESDTPVIQGNHGRGGGGNGSNGGGGQPSNKKGLIFDVSGSQRATMSMSTEKAPQIFPLFTDDEIEANLLTDKAAKFVQTTNVLFVNMKYPSIESAIDYFMAQFADYNDPELVRTVSTTYAQEMIKLLVGKSVVFAKVKRLLSKSWTDKDIEQAMSPESLSIAADGWLNISANYLSKMTRRFKSVSEAA